MSWNTVWNVWIWHLIAEMIVAKYFLRSNPCRVPKRWEIAEICNDKADEKIDEMVVALVWASKITCEWFIPLTAEPIDNSWALIKYQLLGKCYKCLLALCWQFCTFKKISNYFPIIVLFRLKFYVLPFLVSFSSIPSMFDLKPKRRWGKKKWRRDWRQENDGKLTGK